MVKPNPENSSSAIIIYQTTVQGVRLWVIGEFFSHLRLAPRGKGNVRTLRRKGLARLLSANRRVCFTSMRKGNVYVGYRSGQEALRHKCVNK
eukprot:1153592-Pelagomonas_calceolata.AAC.4